MNAVDIAARGLAARALENAATLASPEGAGSIGTVKGGTVQDALTGQRSVLWNGAGQGDAAADTAAFQAAAHLGDGEILIPWPPYGAYLINDEILIEAMNGRRFRGVGPAPVQILYSGSGYCFRGEVADYGDVLNYIAHVSFENIQITGVSPLDGSVGNDQADGAVLIDGAYLVNFAGLIDNFTKPGAKGLCIRNSFNIHYSKGLISVIAAGTGLSIEGDLDGIQTTNLKVGDNALIQRCATAIDLATELNLDSAQIANMALLLNDDGVGVRISGNVANLTLGPALHSECYAATDAGNTSKFMTVSPGAELRTLVADGLVLSNIKTLFDLDGTAATVRDVKIDNVYVAAGNVTTGTGFALKGVLGDLRVDTQNVPSGQYTIFDISGCQVSRAIKAIASTAVPASAPWKGLLASLTDKTVETDRDGLRYVDGSGSTFRVVFATASGIVRAPGDIQWSNQQRIAQVAGDPSGNLSALGGSIAMDSGGRAWLKNTAGYGNSGWAPIANQVTPPASAATAGKPGDWAADSSYFYACIAANSWVRTAVSTW